MTRLAETYALRILVALYAVEATASLILVGLYKAPSYEKLLLSTKADTILVAGCLGLIISGWVFAKQIVLSGPFRGRALAFGLASNLVTLVAIALLLQACVVFISQRTPGGTAVGKV